MPREHDNRPRKPPAEKPPPLEGLNEHGETALGADGEGLDLRAGKHKQELGRSPRDAPSSVNETMSRYKKAQAQKFAEHTPEAIEARNAVVSPADTLPTNAVQPNPVTQQGLATAFDEPVSLGEAKQRRDKKPQKPNKPVPATADADVPIAEHRPHHPQRPQSDMPFEASTHDARKSVHPHKQASPSSPAIDADKSTPITEPHVDEQPRPAGKRSGDAGTAKASPLTHERPSPLKQERERLSHKRTAASPAAPVSSKGRKPNYRKGVTPTPMMPADEHQQAQSTQVTQTSVFDDSPNASRLVHDAVVVSAMTPMSSNEDFPTVSNIRASDADVDSVSRDREIEGNVPTVVETKPTAKTYAKSFSTGRPHDHSPNTTTATPRADTASVESVAGSAFDANATPQTHTATPTHSDAFVDINNTTASSDIGEGNHVPSRTGKTTEMGDRTSDGDAGSVPRDSSGGGGKKRGSKLKFDDTADSPSSSSASPKPSDSSDSVKPSDSTTSSRQLEKAERKVERSSKKLQTAKEKLPTKRKLRTNKEFDPEKGKMKPRLRFEEEVKTQQEHFRGPLVTRPLKTGANMAIGFAHTKVFQVQEENVGVKAAHKGEMLVECFLQFNSVANINQSGEKRKRVKRGALGKTPMHHP